MNYNQEAQELEFAYKVKHALDESAENLPATTLDKLASARKLALSHKKQSSAMSVVQNVFAGNINFNFRGPETWFGRMGLALPILVLMIGLFSLFEYEQQHNINELADIDSAMLADELPPAAYVDNGFSAYINKAEQQAEE